MVHRHFSCPLFLVVVPTLVPCTAVQDTGLGITAQIYAYH
nr:MAG TPA: hypothetical protein [Caudoviricetes sp.]